MKCVACWLNNKDKTRDAVVIYLGKSLCEEHFIKDEKRCAELSKEVKKGIALS